MRKIILATVTAVLLGTGVVTANAATAPERAPVPARPVAADRAGTVTLITGDRVEVTADGPPRITPAPGRTAMPFRVSRTRGRLSVLPGDAAALVAAGALDRRLFDVTGLLDLGYDDTTRPDLPLIVQYKGTAPKAAVSASKTVRPLPSVDGAAVSVTKSGTPGFWSTVTGDAAARTLTAGITRIWLNGRRTPTLDRSTAQIGAPAAWQAGLTGAGVRIAVIDTGIDATHPDLAGRVDAAANFTADPAGDQHGHGTHVASTAAGTGAASGGRYRGVAPDARLLDAKVCQLDGCNEDAMIAGMEWAAAQHAAVANVSIGGPDTAGIDPVEQAVNTLSARYGTLFVVAAGNSGPAAGTVESPGSAEAALTVGAVDRADAVADFSSRGPRTGDGGLKPDIAAPGVDIVAARAAGTELGDVVDDRYTSISGTSMATPHVAGAAALVRQRHPDWTGDQIKNTLMAGARTGAAVPDQGAGRVDVADAVTRTVIAAPGSLSFGVARWPHGDDEPVTRTLTYRNTGTAGVTLDLALAVTGPDGRPTDAPVFTVAPARVVVPANGTAEVTVTADTRPDRVPSGAYTGRLVATGAGTTLATPIGVDKESERYDLRIAHTGRDGGTPESHVTFLDRVGDCGDDPNCGTAVGGIEPGTTLRVPPGRYTLAEFSTTAGTTDVNLFMRMVLDISGDTTITADARKARPVDLDVPRASARMMRWNLGVSRDLGRPEAVVYYSAEGDESTPLFTADLGGTPATDAAVSFVTARFAEPGPAGDFTASPYEYNLAGGIPGRLFTGLRLRPGSGQFATVRTTYAAVTDEPREFRTGHYGQPATGRADLIQFPDFGGPRLVAPMPFRRDVHYLAENLKWKANLTHGDLETGETDFLSFEKESQRYKPGRTYHDTWNQAVLGPQLPTPLITPTGVQSGAVRTGDLFVAAIDQFVDAHPGHTTISKFSVPGQTRLYRDGQLLVDLAQARSITADLPPQPATYRLEIAAGVPHLGISTAVTTAWTFRSEHVDGHRILPLPGVRLTPDLDDHNRARPGPGFAVPVEIYRQPGAGTPIVDTLTVEYSPDDGRTWRPAALARAGKGWVATVNNPAGGTVSLHLRATDTDGNRVEQTVVRAYRVRS
jgi:subtilisin family serine protease